MERSISPLPELAPLPAAFRPWFDGPAGMGALASDEVHLWCAPTALDPTILARLRAHLTSAEEQRVGRFLRPDDRRRQVIARGLVREVLGGLLGVEGRTLAFENGDHGKPRLAGTPDGMPLHFNLSHSGAWVALAVARGTDVGVDIEARSDTHPFAAVAERLFGPDELRWFRAAPAHERPDAFYRLWTVREAYLKAVGTGLAGASGHDILTPAGALADPAWNVARIDGLDGVFGALVAGHGPRRVSAWRL